jgi:hypothetical protein
VQPASSRNTQLQINGDHPSPVPEAAFKMFAQIQIALIEEDVDPPESLEHGIHKIINRGNHGALFAELPGNGRANTLARFRRNGDAILSSCFTTPDSNGAV